ncbi:MAG: hydantoinase B/oxoprolinase family protein, partial [Gammaproteobacteria bacterium]
VTVDLGPPGTLCNASETAPHCNCTTTPMETLTDAVRSAFEQACPAQVAASWGHASGINIAGMDPRTGEQYVTMVLASIIAGAGATRQMDGWHACGPLSCFGALSSGDIELLEYAYPILIHRYGLVTDSAGAGRHRGGSGTCWEVEPLGHTMTVASFGEGRQLATRGAAGAVNGLVEPKLGRLEITRGETQEVHRRNVLVSVAPGERVANYNPGGGGYGPAWERPPAEVHADFRNGLVSRAGAALDYGVVIDADGRLDLEATRLRRTPVEPLVSTPEAA